MTSHKNEAVNIDANDQPIEQVSIDELTTTPKPLITSLSAFVRDETKRLSCLCSGLIIQYNRIIEFGGYKRKSKTDVKRLIALGYSFLDLIRSLESLLDLLKYMRVNKAAEELEKPYIKDTFYRNEAFLTIEVMIEGQPNDEDKQTLHEYIAELSRLINSVIRSKD